MTKQYFLPITLLTILVGGGIFMKSVNAATTTNQQTSLIQKFVNKFNLKESDVESVFIEARTEKQTEMRNRYLERLNQLVTDKKITEAQKNLILAKYDELLANREKERAALVSWASQNGIDLRYLMIGWGMGGGRGMKMGWK